MLAALHRSDKMHAIDNLKGGKVDYGSWFQSLTSLSLCPLPFVSVARHRGGGGGHDGTKVLTPFQPERKDEGRGMAGERKEGKVKEEYPCKDMLNGVTRPHS